MAAGDPDERRGRKTKWSPELQADVCKTLMAGVDIETACRREGISRRTYYYWKAAAERGEEPFVEFMEACERASADVETRVTAQIIKASSTDWRAAAWIKKWNKTGGKTQVEVTGKDGAPIGVLTQEGANAIREKILYGEQGPVRTEADKEEP